jgi:pyruvate dehydrogenase E1 component alpha subunit
VIEDNGYAESTASAWSVGGSQVKRAEGFGMPGVEVNGHDFFAVYEVAKEAIDRARAGEGPSLIHARLDRHYGHFEGDAQTYRAEGEQDQLRAESDCLKIFRQRVIETSLLDAKTLGDIDREVASLIGHAITAAESAPPPSAEDLLTDVYVSY